MSMLSSATTRAAVAVAVAMAGAEAAEIKSKINASVIIQAMESQTSRILLCYRANKLLHFEDPFWSPSLRHYKSG